MLSEKCAVAYFKFKNLIRRNKSDEVQTQNAESQFISNFPLKRRDPAKAVWRSYISNEWKKRKTRFQYSELFSDQYLSVFSGSLLFTYYEPAQVTIYIHFHENSKDKVLKLSRIDRKRVFGQVLDVVSKYPII